MNTSEDIFHLSDEEFLNWLPWIVPILFMKYHKEIERHF